MRIAKKPPAFQGANKSAKKGLGTRDYTVGFVHPIRPIILVKFDLHHRLQSLPGTAPSRLIRSARSQTFPCKPYSRKPLNLKPLTYEPIRRLHLETL